MTDVLEAADGVDAPPRLLYICPGVFECGPVLDMFNGLMAAEARERQRLRDESRSRSPIPNPIAHDERRRRTVPRTPARTRPRGPTRGRRPST